RKMTEEEKKQLEDIVNKKIQEAIPVVCETMTPEQAHKSGALGIFDSKYGETVTVYTIGNFSKEICGGPHVKNTSELGKFKLVKEESSSAGVRRIKGILTD
ncbi:MAG: alanine--tRNA ligase, partial [Christensenellales bacterium]